MYIPTEEEMKEFYEYSYLGEIEMLDGKYGLERAMTYDEWKKDQKEYNYFSFQSI